MGSKYSRQEILDAGILLMRRNGYHATGVDQILKASGVPRGSFYNFFESKEGFAVEAIYMYSRRVLGLLNEVARRTELSAFERVVLVFREAQKEYVSVRYEYSCLMGNLAAEITAENEQVARAVQDQLDLWRAGLAELIAPGIRAGEISGRLSAAQWAHLLLDQYFAAQVRMKLERDGAALDLFFIFLEGLLRTSEQAATEGRGS